MSQRQRQVDEVRLFRLRRQRAAFLNVDAQPETSGPAALQRQDDDNVDPPAPCQRAKPFVPTFSNRKFVPRAT